MLWRSGVRWDFQNVWSQRYASWKKKATTHERHGKTMSEKLPNQTFQSESGMISRTGETSETTVLASALASAGEVYAKNSKLTLSSFYFHH